ncbi:ABC transporter substrate-binding protein [Streptacidiphilus monticola]
MTTSNGTRIAAALVASAAAVSLAACASSKSTASSNPLAPSAAAGGGSDSVTIGGNNFSESTLLADIYGEALKAKGVKVSYKLNIGSREVSYGLLKSGAVTLMPEYNGALLSYLDKTAIPGSAADTDTQLKAKLDPSLQALNHAAAEDKDALVVNKQTADKLHLTKDSSISDLATQAKTLVIGASPEFQTRQQGLLGLKSVYHLDFKSFKALDAGGSLSEAALKNNSVQVADIFTTDSLIGSEGWIALKDPSNLFGFQNVIPVGSKKLSSTAVDALNAVSAKLDTETLMTLDGQVGKGGDPLTVAQTWLKSQGLA